MDLKYALRTLARTPGFTAIAVLTLALGIGANTAIFSLVHAVILTPLPFHDPSKLVAIWDTYLPEFDKLGASPLEVAAWRQQTDLFEDSAWYRYVPKSLNLTTPGVEAIEVHATCASERLFPMLGVRAELGRTFGPEEDPHAAILSQRLWQTRFGGNPAVVGKALRLNEEEFTIIGIMPAGFQFPDWADLWLTQAQMGDEMTNPVRHSVGLVSRLRAGADLRQVTARSQVIARRLSAAHPKTSQGWGMKIAGLQDDLTAKVRPAILMLLGAVAMVLLIACANVANLLLSRATARAREMAVRTALGAGVRHLIRQLLTESIVLSMAGGICGLLIARWALTLSPIEVPLDSSILLFALGISLATGVVFGLVPVTHALHSDPSSVIKTSSVTGGGAAKMRSTLVMVEFALAIVLITGAGILVKSFLRLMHVNPGFDPHGLLTMRIALPPSRKPDVVFHRLDERLRELPGVQSIAASNALPLIANRADSSRFKVPGSPLINPDALPAAQIRVASPAFFHTMRIPLRSGRAFTERDMNQPVVIINETMARRFWPGRDPVGLKYITGPWGPNPAWSTIVGVAGDVKQFGLDSEPSFDEYFPSLAPAVLILRVSGDPMFLAPAIEREIHTIDSGLPISDVRTMDEVMSESARSRRWTMGLLAAFAGLALVLALVGIYGVMSWSVTQRTREIGIRMAIGAQSGQVLGLVLRDALKLAAIGLGTGVLGGLALRQVLSSLVFDVSPADPFIYVGAVLLMLAAALLACYVPARRASRADPLAALRCE